MFCSSKERGEIINLLTWEHDQKGIIISSNDCSPVRWIMVMQREKGQEASDREMLKESSNTLYKRP